MAGGFIGILVVLRPGVERLEPAALGILLAALLFAVSTIIARKIGEDEPLVAPFHYVQLLWGTLFGIVIFSTVPDVWMALGASLIVMSGLFLIYREHVRHREITAVLTAHGGFDQE